MLIAVCCSLYKCPITKSWSAVPSISVDDPPVAFAPIPGSASPCKSLASGLPQLHKIASLSSIIKRLMMFLKMLVGFLLSCRLVPFLLCLHDTTLYNLRLVLDLVIELSLEFLDLFSIASLLPALKNSLPFPIQSSCQLATCPCSNPEPWYNPVSLQVIRRFQLFPTIFWSSKLSC